MSNTHDLGLTLCVVAMLGASTSSQAQAPLAPTGEPGECALDLIMPSSVYYRGAYGRGYGIFDDARHQELVQVQVAHRGQACGYVLAIASRSGGGAPVLRGASGELRYDIRGAGGNRNLASRNDEGDSGAQLSGSFSDGARAFGQSFYIEVPPGQLARFGRYEDLIQFRLYRDNAGQLSLVEEAALGVAVDVPASVRAGVGDLGAASRIAEVDFGQLATGARRDLSFSVVSNADVSVTFTSLQGGLRHGPSQVVIPYQVTFGGQRVALNGGQSFPLTTDVARAIQPAFSVEVGEVKPNAPAGTYTDTLQVTISAK